jgi:peptidoglycan LD-endopeptidase LytH
MRVGIKTKITISILLTIISIGLIIPEQIKIPVDGASNKDWNHNTFWYEPWGKSGVHKGIDIFSSKGTPVLSSTSGIILYKGQLQMGGKVIVILGPKWRLHYYAHLDSYNVEVGSIVKTSEVIGSVGDSGNAKGKTPHLHYSIVTLLPHVWNWDLSTQGWKKMFYLNPSKHLLSV